MLKYILTDQEETTHAGTIFHRVKALKDFGDVKKGNVGG